MITDLRVRWSLGIATFAAMAGTAGAVLGVAGVSGVVGGLLIAWAAAVQDSGAATADRAIGTHTDPGPAGRAAADERARALLFRPARDEWLGLGLLLLVGAGGLVDGAVRAQPEAAVAGAVLVLLTPVWWFAHRRTLLAASRWLDAPPYPREEA